MSPRYAANPTTGTRRTPPGEGLGTALFEFVLAFVALTGAAGAIFCCIELWALMLGA